VPVALVQHAFHHLDSGSTNEVAFPHEVGRHDLILVAMTTAQMSVNTVQDNLGSLYRPIEAPVDSSPPDQRNPVHVELWWTVSAGGTHAVTVNFAPPPDLTRPPDSDVGIYEYAGLTKRNQVLYSEKSVAAVGVGNQPDAGRLRRQSDFQGDELYFVVGGDG